MAQFLNQYCKPKTHAEKLSGSTLAKHQKEQTVQSDQYIWSGHWPSGKLFYYPAYLEGIIAMATVAFTSVDEARTDPAMCLHHK